MNLIEQYRKWRMSPEAWAVYQLLKSPEMWANESSRRFRCKKMGLELIEESSTVHVHMYKMDEPMISTYHEAEVIIGGYAAKLLSKTMARIRWEERFKHEKARRAKVLVRLTVGE